MDFSSHGNGQSYFHNPGSEPLLYLTIGQLIHKAAETWPDSLVFQSVQHQTSLTYSQADQQSSKLAAGFIELGLVPGDRLAICSPNSTEWYLTALAAAKAGLILVLMNPAYLASELEYCLQKVGVKVVVTDEVYKIQKYYEMLSQIIPELSSLPGNSEIRSSKFPKLTHLILISDNVRPGSFRFCDILEKADSLEKLLEVEKKVRPEFHANIQFTSGTTGRPKAVPLSHMNLINNGYFDTKRLRLLKKPQRILAQTPFFHALGFVGVLLVNLFSGSTIILPSAHFVVSESAETIKKHKCTMLVGTPTMYVDLCNHVHSLPAEEQLLYQSPELAMSGGALCAPELFRKMKSTFSCDRVVSVYGLTESTAACFQSEADDSVELMTTTVGRVSEHVEAKVVDTEGVTVPLGTPGELWMRSYNVMDGYWQDKENTENMITSDRWLKTGDKVILMENGYCQVVGRIKDMIIRGGENISPKEVEEFMLSHPDVIEAQVYGVKNERLGEEVACSLRVKDGSILQGEEARNYCKGKIAYFKIPRYFEIVDEFPKTGSGKIQKYKLKEAMENKLALNT